MRASDLFRGRKFWPLFVTQFLGAFNDNLFKNALVFLIAFKGIQVVGMHSESLVALSGGLFILPFFLFSATAGQLADRYPKHKIVRLTKLWEILVMLLAAFGFYWQWYSLLLFVLFLMGMQSTFFGPVKYSLLPELLEEQELVGGNAYIEMGTFLAILLGTIAGGLMSALPNAEIWIIIGVLSVAVAGFVFSLWVPKVEAQSSALKISWDFFKPTLEILKISAKKKAVFYSLLAISWFWFLGAGILSLVPFYGKSTLGGNQQVVTFLLALFTLGIGLGSIICEKLSFDRVEIGLVPIGSLGISLFLFDLFSIIPSWDPRAGLMNISDLLSHSEGLRIMFDFFMFSLFGGFYIVPLYTLLQQRSEAGERSRVIAANNIFNALFMVISSLLLMAFYHWKLTNQQIFLMYGLLNLLVAFYVYFKVPEFTLRFWAWVLSHFLYRLKVFGWRHVPEKGPVLLVCNHQSFVDWLIISGAIKRPIRFVMYYKFLNIPFLKHFMKQAKVIPIAGKNEDLCILKQAFETMKESLSRGEVVCIFPEGNLTPDGQIKEFKKGVEKLLKELPVPVVPMALEGLWGGFFSRVNGKAFSVWPRWRHPVKLVVGRPLKPEGLTAKSLEAEVKKLFEVARTS
ncbi:MAG: MFS transporter [Bdellovibrio sp.]|nr:MAG: MFS transporter [Bdellovibrio sp.]